MTENIDILITGGMVLLPGAKLREGRGIAVKGTEIVDVASNSALREKYRPDQTIDAADRVILPGLIDGHVHNAQIPLRGAISDEMTTLPPVWLNFLIPFEDELTKEQVRISSLFSNLNAIKSGVTTFVEAGGPYPEEIAKAGLESGLRAVITKSTVDTDPGIPTYQETREVLDEYECLIQEWGQREGRISIWPSFREIMLNSPDLIGGLFELKEKYDTGVTAHLAESRTEVDYCLEHYGKRPVEFFHDGGFLDEKVLVAHAIFVNDRELEILQDTGTNVTWCPSVDAELMGPSRAGEMLQRGVNVVFGSDGGAWNNMDLFEQARIGRASISQLNNSLYHEKRGIGVSSAIKMLTANGATVLDDQIGQLKAGNKADIIVLDSATNLVPRNETLDGLVNMVSAHNVKTTIVDGEVLMEENEVVSLDEEALTEVMNSLSRDLRDKIRKLKEDLFS